MAVTFAEKFVRAHAELAVKGISVVIDTHTGIARLSFHGRNAEVDLRAMVLQEDAFRHLAEAVDMLLCIPARSVDSEEAST